MRQVRNFAILAPFAALVGCATPPASPPPVAVAAHVIPANPSTAAPASKMAIPRGYTHVIMDNGEERYCRNDVATGSRLDHQKVCLTAQQLADSESGTQDMMNQMQRHNAATNNSGPQF